MTKLPWKIQVRRNQSGIIPDARLDRTAEMPINSTVYAIDVNTGSVDWEYSMDRAHRGGLLASG